MPKTTLSPEMQENYRREVQRVNKQLYRLEKAYADKPEKLMETAYGSIMRDIKAEFGDQKRFGKSMPANMNEYRKRMNIIQRFYDKPTSTLSGTRRVYENRAETLSGKLGVNVTADDLKAFFDNGLWASLRGKYDSAKSVKYWATIERQRDRAIKQLREGKKVTFRGRYAKDVNSIGLDEMLRSYLTDIGIDAEVRSESEVDAE